jgi:hypothetical protein
MKISIGLDYIDTQDPVLVKLCLSSETDLWQRVIDLSAGIKQLEIEFYLQSCALQQLKLSFNTVDIKIVKNPITITDITLDDFYSTDRILYSGAVFPDDKFKLYSKIKNYQLDSNMIDSNRLDFTGELRYFLKWPFYRNVYDENTIERI